MKNSTYKLIVALLLLIIVVGGILLACQTGVGQTVEEPTQVSEATEQTEAAEYAPDFTVTDGEGNEYRLSDFRGTPVVLNFWATWCGPCKSELPEFESAYLEYGDQVQFMMVDLVEGRSETVEDGLAYVSDNGYTFPLFFDSNQEASAAYSITAIPQTWFIDGDGKVVSSQIGMISADVLRDGIESILPD